MFLYIFIKYKNYNEKQKEEMCKKINLRIEKLEKQKDVLVKKILIG